MFCIYFVQKKAQQRTHKKNKAYMYPWKNTQRYRANTQLKQFYIRLKEYPEHINAYECCDKLNECQVRINIHWRGDSICQAHKKSIARIDLHNAQKLVD